MTNDNSDADIRGISPLSTAHGRAALLLVESLIHGLCENHTLSASAAAEITERAASVELDQAVEALDGEGALMRQSHMLLQSIAASLKIDDIGGKTQPEGVS